MIKTAAGLKFVLIVAVSLIAGGLSVAARADSPRNHLGDESSPYLQLHAADPVHWRAWSADTLARAKAAGKPILLSIGYSSCHWCHVMRREAFADEETAVVINTLFFPIMIDREERPDIDAVYQSAALAMSLPTGWPLNMFLTPNAKPFWGGTYFPKDALRGMAPFKVTLRQVSKVFTDDPSGVEKDADNVARFLKQSLQPKPGTITLKAATAAAKVFLGLIDTFNGGFGESSKFPYMVALDTLWRAYLRTEDKSFADAVTATLTSMRRGGLYDHVGGGFFRYAVDPLWLVPHYEKMLDVNAGMVRLMTQVWRETGDGMLERTVAETIGFLISELRFDGGAFAGSLDADSLVVGSRAPDSEEREGAFYLWDKKEILKVLGDDGPLIVAAYGIAAPENALGEDLGDAGTLYRSEQPVSMLADTFKLSKSDVRQRLSRGLAALKRQRAKRHRPRRDDKILADWNGMAVTAIAEAGLAFNRPDWVEAALQAFEATQARLSDQQGRLRHSAMGKELGAPATLSGLAELSRSALVLFEATGEKKFLDKANRWAEAAFRHHWDNNAGGFFTAADDAGPSMARLKPVMDDPNASGNAKMAEVLSLLYYLKGEAKHLDRAQQTLLAVGGVTKTPSLQMAGLFNAAETLNAALQIVLVGNRGDKATDALFNRVMGTSLPNRALDVIKAGTVLPEGHPARYKEQIDGKATAYVCRGTVCSLPVTDNKDLTETLLLMRKGDKF